MVSPKKFLKTLKRKKGWVIETLNELFETNAPLLSIEIGNPPEYTPAFLYYDPKQRKVLFSPSNFSGDVPFQKIIKKCGIKMAAIYKLAHECTHYVYDYKTSFEAYRELENLLRTKSPFFFVADGISEGIAIYGEHYCMKKTNFYSDFCQVYEAGVKAAKLMIKIFPRETFNFWISAATLLADFYWRKFEKEGYSSFLKFVNSWRPHQVGLEDFKLLIKLIKN